MGKKKTPEAKAARKIGKQVGEAFGGLGKALSAGLDSWAEAIALIEAENETKRKREKELRDNVDTQIEIYERETGTTFYLDGGPEEPEDDNKPATVESTIKVLPYEAWDYDNKGHLINCSNNCMSVHCLTCGARTFGRDVYCSRHDND